MFSVSEGMPLKSSFLSSLLQNHHQNSIISCRWFGPLSKNSNFDHINNHQAKKSSHRLSRFCVRNDFLIMRSQLKRDQNTVIIISPNWFLNAMLIIWTGKWNFNPSISFFPFFFLSSIQIAAEMRSPHPAKSQCRNVSCNQPIYQGDPLLYNGTIHLPPPQFAFGGGHSRTTSRHWPEEHKQFQLK